MPDLPAHEATVWTDGPRAAKLGEAIDLMGAAVRVIAVGGPRISEVDQLARRFDCAREDDLRKMLIEHPAAFVLLGTLDEATPADLATAVEQGSMMLAIEPAAAHADEIDTLTSGDAATPALVVAAPAFLASPGWTRAADPREALGQPRTLQFDSCGRPDEQSLFARLFDAWLTVLHFVGMPQSVDAALVGPVTDVPKDPRGLTGSLSAHARLGDGAAAYIHVSDRASVSRRRLHTLSDAADLLVRDSDYQLHDAAGQLIDEHRPKLARTGFADLIAAQWQRLLDRRDAQAPDPAGLDPEALACCHACLLSARTGTPEDPAKILQMHR